MSPTAVRKGCGLLLFCLLLATSPTVVGQENSGPSGADSIEEITAEAGFSLADADRFLQQYCSDCHTGEDAESGLKLEGIESVDDLASAIESWNRIASRVRDGQMPPQESDLPEDSERKQFVSWVRQTIHDTVCDSGEQPGRPVLRRLSRTEYANTVRDLLDIHVDAGHSLPAEGAGGEGFDNAAETLFISPIYAEKFLEAARSALGHALLDPEAREQLITVDPSDDRSPDQAARAVLEDFLPKAFRRPVTESELDEYEELFSESYAQDESYLRSIRFALEAALVSPKFLFLYETPPTAGTTEPLDDYELASRLSYFLWASMPDRELFELAGQGKLQDEKVLADQVRRMLRSSVDRRGLRRGAKVRDFASSFIEQWLGTRALGREFRPDPKISFGYDSELEGGMKYEPIFFLEDLLADNRSLLNLIDSDFTYVNRRLARHYRIGGEFREQPKKVKLQAKHHRGGLLGMSAVLAVTSFPHRTSPVLRGKWILETILGTPPPPPPPNVPALDESEEHAKPTSLRERLELHRTNPTCASCHDAMDPLGFGLENYDVLGRWRTVDDGVPIDVRGELPGGLEFEGPEQLKQLIMERKDQFIRHFTSKMFGYALARGLSNEDQCVVDAIADKVAEDEYLAQTLVLEIVKSSPFRTKSTPADATR